MNHLFRDCKLSFRKTPFVYIAGEFPSPRFFVCWFVFDYFSGKNNNAKPKKQNFEYHHHRKNTTNLKQSNEGLKPSHLVVVAVVVGGQQPQTTVGQIVSLKLAPKAVLVHRVHDGAGRVRQHLKALKVHLAERQVRLEVICWGGWEKQRYF